MRIQFLNGGLANQAFQYIFARYYALEKGESMYLDDTYFALNTVHNGYELEKVFGIKAPMLSDCFDEEVWEYILQQRRQGKSVPTILNENGIPFYMVSEAGDRYKSFNPFEGKVVLVTTNEYHPDILNCPDDVYYHGYWINKRWFAKYKAEFLEEFQFPEITDSQNKKYLEWIQSTNSVSIHIRRGDYVTLGWSLDSEIYRVLIDKFIQEAPGKWELFVFSDDILWCREHEKELGFGAFEGVTYIEGNIQGKNYIDMQLMSKCKGMILSNSAFCYLASLLNTEKLCSLNPTSREI